MKKTCCLFVLLSMLLAEAGVNSSTRLIDAGTTKVIPFDDTISPDGAYAIGWTVLPKTNTTKPIDWSKWTADTIEDFFVSNTGEAYEDSFADSYSTIDCLIDLKTGKYLELSSSEPEYPRKNRGYLFAVWGPNTDGVRHALVENDSRFYTENAWLVTIDFQGMHATDLASTFDKAIAPVLQTKRPIFAADYETFFQDFKESKQGFFKGDALILPFSADIPKSLSEKSVVEGTITYRISDGVVVKVESNTPVDDPLTADSELGRADRELNVIYAKLAKSLNTSDREALKKEQVEWISQRNQAAEHAMNTVSDENPPPPIESRDKSLLDSTRVRLVELRGRLK